MSIAELKRRLEAKIAELKALDEDLSNLWFKREKLFQEIDALKRELQRRRDGGEGEADI